MLATAQPGAITLEDFSEQVSSSYPALDWTFSTTHDGDLQAEAEVNHAVVFINWRWTASGGEWGIFVDAAELAATKGAIAVLGAHPLLQ